jgi:ABC-type Zn uptake system ZnuABC Zn-binding protein ZnuA
MKGVVTKIKPSEELTDCVKEAYENYQEKLVLGRKEDELTKKKADYDHQILELVKQGYTVLKDSEYAVLVTNETQAPQWKERYYELTEAIAKGLPEHASYVNRTAKRVVKKSLQSTKEVVFYDSSENLDKKIASIQASEDRREGIKEVKLVRYP